MSARGVVKYDFAGRESEAQRPPAPISSAPPQGSLSSILGSRVTFSGSSGQRSVGFVGDNCVEATPVPIPNTAVKLYSADGTAGAARWESTSSPALC